MESIVKLTKTGLLLLLMAISQVGKAQIDTLFFNPSEFVVFLGTDTANYISKKPWLGNPADIKDRIYGKNKRKVNQKKSYDIGFAFAAFDSAGAVRQQTFALPKFKSEINSEMDAEGRLFYLNANTSFATSYFLQPNGSFSSFLFDLNSKVDSVLQKELNTLMVQFAPKDITKYQSKQVKLFYKLTFLKNGMFESYGYLIMRNGELYKIGPWQEFNPMCNCLIQKFYR